MLTITVSYNDNTLKTLRVFKYVYIKQHVMPYYNLAGCTCICYNMSKLGDSLRTLQNIDRFPSRY